MDIPPSPTHPHHPPKSPFKVRRQLCQTSFQFSGKALAPWYSDILSLFLYFFLIKKGWNSCPVRKLPHLAIRSLQTGFIHCIKSQVWQRWVFFFFLLFLRGVCSVVPHGGGISLCNGLLSYDPYPPGPAWIACLFCFSFSPSTSPVMVAECSRKSLKRKKGKGCRGRMSQAQFLVHNVYLFIL